MNAQHRDAAWDRRIAAAGARAEGCPSPEDWHRAAIGEPTEEERRRLGDHAAGCPACAAERDLARTFAAGPDPAEAAATSADVTAIVARLEARPPHRVPRPAEAPAAGAGAARSRGGRLLRFPVRFGGAATALAAAAALVLALGLAYQAGRGAAPPALPDRPQGGPHGNTMRGGVIDELAPAGELAEPPESLSWEPVAGAASYRIELLAVDDRVLWEGEAAAPPTPLPDAVMPLSSAIAYGWRVEAIDREGRLIASSERATFRIRPTPEAPPEAPTED